MACCDYFEQSQRDDTIGEGEKDYREHVAAQKISFGEIFVVVAAVVMLAGMSMMHQTPTADGRITGSISSSYSRAPLGGSDRCDSDRHLLTQSCER